MDPDLQTFHEAAISSAIVSTSIATGGATAGAAGMYFVAASSVWAPLQTAPPCFTAAPAFKYRYFVERRPAPRSGNVLTVYQTTLSIACMLAGGCFVAGTPIVTADGAKAIEEIRPADRVLTAPDGNPDAEPELRAVVNTFQYYLPTLALQINGRIIRTTLQHPFWVRGHGWTEAKKLQAGQQLRSSDGRWISVEGIGLPTEAVPVYNLQVADYHTYFVGEPAWGFSVWRQYGPLRFNPQGVPRSYQTYTKSNPTRPNILW